MLLWATSAQRGHAGDSKRTQKKGEISNFLSSFEKDMLQFYVTLLVYILFVSHLINSHL